MPKLTAVPVFGSMIPIAPPAEVIAVETTPVSAKVAAAEARSNISVTVPPSVTASPKTTDPKAVGVIVAVRPIIARPRGRGPMYHWSRHIVAWSGAEPY